MMKWEKLELQRERLGPQTWFDVYRSKVLGGWLLILIYHGEGSGLTFYPDPDHEWDGGSLHRVSVGLVDRLVQVIDPFKA